MIAVHRIRISKDQFQKMEEDERLALILLGHMFNQMGVQFKMLSFSMNNDVESEIEQSVSAAQTHILLRLFLGTLFETWDTINNRIVKQHIWEKYSGITSAAGVSALATLQDHFEKSNILVQIRNNIAYHYPNDKLLKRAFDDTAADEPWDWYLSDKITNSFYFSSDVVVSHSFIPIAGETNVSLAFKKIMGEVGIVVNCVNDFMMALMAAIVSKNFPDAITKRELAAEISDAPNRREFFIPFYAEDTD